MVVEFISGECCKNETSDAAEESSIKLELSDDEDSLHTVSDIDNSESSSNEDVPNPAPAVVEQTVETATQQGSGSSDKLLKELVTVLVPCVDGQKHPFATGYSKYQMERIAKLSETYEQEKKPWMVFEHLPNRRCSGPYGKGTRKIDRGRMQGKTEEFEMFDTYEHLFLMKKHRVSNYAAVVNQTPAVVFFDYDTEGNKEERLKFYEEFEHTLSKFVPVVHTVSHGGRSVCLASAEFVEMFKEIFGCNRASFKLENGCELEIFLRIKPDAFTTGLLPDSPETFNQLHEEVYSKKINDWGTYHWAD